MHSQSLWRKAGRALALALAVATVGGPALSDDRRSIVVAVQDIPDSLEVAGPARNITYRVLYNVYDQLIGADFNNDYALQPALATAWRRVDQTTMELDLRRGVRFHDGREMTAEDVVFSFGPQRVAGEDAPAFKESRQFIGTIDKVEAVGDWTVRFTTKRPDPILHLRLAGWMSQVISREAFLKAGSFEDWSRNPVATGPYRVASFVPDDHVLLEAHDGYWGGKPPFATIRFQAVPETATRIAGLAAGDYDIVTDIAPDQFKTVDAMDCCQVVGGPVNNIRLINYSRHVPALRDPRLRQAMSLAIDRQLIVDTLWAGRVDVPRGLQSSSFGDLFVADHPMPAYDPDKARALVAESGYQGEVIPLHVQAGYYTAQLATAQILVDMWRDVGLEVALQVKEGWGQILLDEPAYIFDYSSTEVYPDPLSSIARNYGPASYIQNIKMWENDEFNKLTETLSTSLDQAARKVALKRMLEIFHHEDPGGTVLHTLGLFYGKRKDIAWAPYPNVYMDLGPRNSAALQ